MIRAELVRLDGSPDGRSLDTRTPTPLQHYEGDRSRRRVLSERMLNLVRGEPTLVVRRHWLYPVLAIVGSKRKIVFSLIVSLTLATLGWATHLWWIIAIKIVLIASHSVYTLYCVTAWHRDVILVTPHHVFRVRGVFTSTISEIELAKIKERLVYQSFIGRIFGYGTVQMKAADGADTRMGVLDYIPNPLNLCEASVYRGGQK